MTPAQRSYLQTLAHDLAETFDKESDGVGRVLAKDRPRKAHTKSKKGQGGRGDC